MKLDLERFETSRLQTDQVNIQQCKQSPCDLTNIVGQAG